MNRPVAMLTALTILFFVCVAYMVVIEAQIEDKAVCTGLPEFIEGEDLTALMLEGYTVEYQSARWQELAILLSVDFEGSPSNGFYNWYGTWVVLNKIEGDRYRLWAGTDWTIGDDKQLHNPTCYIYISDSYEWFFAWFKKCRYPDCMSLQ